MNMKSIAAACAAAAGTLAAATASAGTFQVNNGGVWGDGTVQIAGGTTASPLGNPVPCNATFTLTVSGGNASVTGATFSGNGACTSITTNLGSWPVTINSYSGTSTNVTISGISLHFTSPNTTCTGSITGVLTNSHPNGGGNDQFTFSGSLGTCTSVKSTSPTPTSTKGIQD